MESNFSTYLRTLDYSDTETIDTENKTGQIPTFITRFKNLVNIHMSGNNLTGSIPKDLCKISTLQEIYINNNNLTGKIPIEIGNLHNLQELCLSNNKLTGTIPIEIGNLHNLQELYLSNNKLTGTIPNSVGQLLNLEKLSLSDNKLSGTVPKSIGLLVELQELFIENNRLTGTIPMEVQKLKNLTEFDFYGNMFDKLSLRNYSLRNIKKYHLQNLMNYKEYNSVKELIEMYIFTGKITDIFTIKVINKVRKLIKKVKELTNDPTNEEAVDIIKRISDTIYHHQKQLYPQIDDTLKNHVENVYVINAHGRIKPEKYIFIPDNLSIITLTTPGYSSYLYSENSLLSLSTKMYLNYLLPGISYGKGRKKKNQLRFFKSGDIINNILLNFKMEYPKNNNNNVHNGGIIRYIDIDSKSSRPINGKAKLNLHIKNGDLSWGEITENSYESDLVSVIKKFRNRHGHYLIILTSCQDFNALRIVKQVSPVYTNLSRKLECFQDLIPVIQRNENLGIQRLQNLSSTYKHNGNCYLELVSKLRKIIDINDDRKKTASNMLKYIEQKYNDIEIVEYNALKSILKMFDEPQKGGIKKRYVFFKKYGKRLVRHYKNGKEYCIINGKKVKIEKFTS